MKKRIYTVVFIIMVVLFDQLSKYLINRFIKLDNSFIIIKRFLKFTNSHNYGAAYGILSGKMYILVIISIIVLIYLLIEMRKKLNKYLYISYTFIIAGLIGNLIDRLFLGYVRDFISFTLINYEAAIFNISDMFIFFGAVIMFYSYIKEDYEKNSSRQRTLKWKTWCFLK